MRTRRDVVVATACAALALAPRVAGGQQPAAPPPPSAPSAAAPAGALGAVHGVVYDSLGRGPLAGATVQIVRAGDLLGGRAATADSAGAFRIDALAPGRYLVSVEHPLLDLLGVEVRPRLVALGPGGDVVRVDLGVPALERVRPAVCESPPGGPPAPADSSGLLAGRVRDADDGAPVANATVVLTWSEPAFGTGGVRVERRRVPVPTGADGRYVVCGVPAGVDLVATAAAPGRASGEVALEMPVRGFVRRDLALGDTASVAAAAAAVASSVATPAGAATTAQPGAGDAAPGAARVAAPSVAAPSVAAPAVGTPAARGTARLSGTVRDSAGRPVGRARVSVWGTAAAAVAGADGAFALSALPAGTRTLEVRAIGFAPRRVPVDLAAGRASRLDVPMGSAVVPTLGRVTVYGTAIPLSRTYQEFLDRRRSSAFGRFVTSADLLRTRPPQVSWALRTVPGLQLAPNGRLGSTILGRGARGFCPALVVLDGMPLEPSDDIDLFVAPQQVTGIEVYAEGAFAPPQYVPAGRGACGVVLIWTL